MNSVLRTASVFLVCSFLFGKVLALEVAYFLALEGPTAVEVELSRKSGAGPAATAAGVLRHRQRRRKVAAGVR